MDVGWRDSGDPEHRFRPLVRESPLPLNPHQEGLVTRSHGGVEVPHPNDLLVPYPPWATIIETSFLHRFLERDIHIVPAEDEDRRHRLKDSVSFGKPGCVRCLVIENPCELGSLGSHVGLKVHPVRGISQDEVYRITGHGHIGRIGLKDLTTSQGSIYLDKS